MEATHLFEDFGSVMDHTSNSTELNEDKVEDQKLASFESGYQAGWEDAIKAQTETNVHVSSALAESLQEASFNYHEMRSVLNRTVQEVMTRVNETLLPMIARETLGAHIHEQIAATVRAGLDRTIEVTVSPESLDTVQSVLSDRITKPFEIVADPLLAPEQAVLRLGPDEQEIDLNQVVSEISNAISAFFQSQNQEVANG